MRPPVSSCLPVAILFVLSTVDQRANSDLRTSLFDDFFLVHFLVAVFFFLVFVRNLFGPGVLDHVVLLDDELAFFVFLALLVRIYLLALIFMNQLT